jgi:hypothetical protein
MNCQDATLSLGVYLLGALSPVERAEVDVHLKTCADCQRELAELAALPSILELLTVEDVEAASAGGIDQPLSLTPSDDLFDRVAAEARSSDATVIRGRFTRFQQLSAAAAAVVVLGGVGVGAVALHHHSGRPAGTRTVSAISGPVHMRVKLTAQTEGTALDVDVAGLPKDEHCWLIAVGSDGSREVTEQWDATYGGRAQVSGSTRIPINQLSQLILLGSDHQPLDTISV